MVSQTPLPPSMTFGIRVDVDGIILYSARTRERGTQTGTADWIPNISAFTRVSTRYARE